jgi:hypothetical protein
MEKEEPDCPNGAGGTVRPADHGAQATFVPQWCQPGFAIHANRRSAAGASETSWEAAYHDAWSPTAR